MKAVLALVCSLFVASGALAQCAGGACYSNFVPAGYYQPVQYYYSAQPVITQPVVQGWGEANHTHRCGNCGLLFDHSANYDPTKSHICPNCKTGPWNVIESFTSAPAPVKPVVQQKVTELKTEILIASSKFSIFGGEITKDSFSIMGDCGCKNCECAPCNCSK